jgi:cathepsin D
LGWQSIASSKASPLWQTLATSGAWTDPVMAFQLTRFVNATNVNTEEPGGSFTMGMSSFLVVCLQVDKRLPGFVNSSLYTGTIDYQALPLTPSYWILPMKCESIRRSTLQSLTSIAPKR